jgi:glyoxylase-like metal-dependent hydrolase (beta-lactamase superfamily II)
MFFDDSTDRIEAALAEAGLSLKSIDQIVVTHAHPDHFGAAAWLSAVADAPIVCGAPEAAKLVSFGPEHEDERRHHYMTLLASVGVPTELQDTFSQMRAMVADQIRPVAASMLAPLNDRDGIRIGGRTFEAHVTPGHSVGHLSLHQGRTLVSGDHLLAHITPNPFIEAEDTPLGRRRSLVEYLASLVRFETLDPAVVLPGHGPAFRDVRALAMTLRAHHDKRANEILALIVQSPGSTIHELAQAYFRGLESYHVVLGISEVAGHVDLLDVRGDVMSHGAPQRIYARS